MNESGLALLRKYKTGVACLPLSAPEAGRLRPAGTDLEDAACLTEWRNRFATSFLTEFEATTDRTHRWLTETVASDDTRILFMLDLLDGTTVGYLGLAFIDWEVGRGEADAIVRGGNAPRGLMTEALQTLLRWANRQLGLKHLGVRVRSDNPALRFYEKAGFCETHRIPLRRIESPDMVTWVEDQANVDSHLDLVHLVWTDRR